MAEYIVMPKLGFDMREGVLNNWLKEVGEEVQKGDVVAEIESDKATLELESQVSGVLLKYLAEAGDVVPIGANVAIVGEEGEDVSGLSGDGDGQTGPESTLSPRKEEVVQPEEAVAEEPRLTRAPEAKAEPAADGEAPALSGADGTAVGEEYPEGTKATPVARRVAREHDVDLRQVSGSGPEGRIRKADVEAYLERQPEAAEEARPAARFEPTPVAAGPDTSEVEMTRLRQAIGRRMAESKTTVPHFYVTTQVAMDEALALRKQINEKLPDEQKVTVNDMIVKAAALTLRDFPNLNASFAGDKLVRHNRINVGSAVAVEGGLLTVVQKDTDSATLSKIAADNKAMIARAREGRSRPDDFEGSTFTVSNLGAYDVDHFVAIINPPEAAILAVGTASQVPVVENGELAIGTRMKATISADHRVTDGAEAARYLQAFKGLLEEPLRLLL
jgi:pyruvate dehydrogenase E2 component (dihydrolipoamide acetyltransferase)